MRLIGKNDLRIFFMLNKSTVPPPPPHMERELMKGGKTHMHVVLMY